MAYRPNHTIIHYDITSSVLIGSVQKRDRRQAEKCFLHFAQFSTASLIAMEWGGDYTVLANSWKPPKR